MNQKGLSLVLIIVFIAAALGGFVIYQQQGSQPKSIPSPQPTIQASLISDETAGWKTYQNKMYSFRYPSSWSLFDEPSEQILYDQPNLKGPQGPDYRINFFLYERRPDDLKIVEPLGTKTERGDKIFYEKIEDIKLDGKIAAKYKIEVLPGSQTDAIPGITIYSDIDSQRLSINLLTSKPDDIPTNIKIFNQILSTFKFTQ